MVEGRRLNQTLLEKYASFFPFANIDPALSLGEGFTPLVESKRTASNLGVERVLFKNETLNPTWSFKDRGTIAGVQHAVELGLGRIGTVSTGNMAVSVAAYGARAGLETFVLVSETIPEEKLAPIAIHEPTLIRVKGDYGELYFESLRLGEEKGVYFINSDVPFRVEGSKTIAFEIAEQLSFRAPDFVIVPTSAGGNFRGIQKGFQELLLSRLIDRLPRLVCAQAGGCSPIFSAYSKTKAVISRVPAPNTIAHAIENPFPPSGNEVLRRLRDANGLSIAVDDEEIITAQREMAREGIFGQPAAAVPLAALMRMKEQGIVGDKDVVVCIVTGSGLKYTAALQRHALKIANAEMSELGEIL